MKKPSVMRNKPDPATVTLPLPVLDDGTAVTVYNFLCEIVDGFDTHYGEQICRFYAQQDSTYCRTSSRPIPDDPPF